VGDGVFEVKATSGDTFLGGDDFDQRIIDYLIQEFQRENSFNLRNDKQAIQRLKEAAERAKIELSSTLQTEINLPYLTADANGPKHLVVTLTRSKVEQICGDLIERTLNPIRQALGDANLLPAKIDEVVLVGGMTRMPAIQETVRRFFAKEPHKGVNPDEVVAIGAAIQAGVLAGQVKDVLLLDVTPLTLSIETMGGVATALITRNTTIPTRRSEVFSTADDNQPQVEIHVVQGERSLAADNKTLGKFILDGISPAPRGVPQIDVTFDIDVNGILKVTAKDRATGRSQHITLTASSGLSAEEVERMRKDAEEHADADRKQRSLIEVRNSANHILYTAVRFQVDNNEKIPQQNREEIEQAVSVLRNVIQIDDADAIHASIESLDQTLQRAGSFLYGSKPKADSQNYNDETAPYDGLIS
jgi:molecular chaperone DnaK